MHGHLFRGDSLVGDNSIESNSKAFFSKTLRFILCFLYLWSLICLGDNRKEEHLKFINPNPGK
jgi:hypothetical protein